MVAMAHSLLRKLAPAALLAPCLLAAAETPEALLGAAIHHQEAEGNLDAAIAGYRKFLAQFPRHPAAALLRLGDCYQKQGRPEARSAYQRVIAEYASQVEVAAQARARLAALRPRRAEVVNRRIFSLTHSGYFCATSPDERYVTLFESAPNRRGLFLREIATGKERLLSEKGFVGRSMTFSPDSKVVAFLSGRPQLRLVNADGTGERVLLESPEIAGITAHDWSADGRWILVMLVRRDQTRQLSLVSVPDGAVRILKTLQWPGQVSVARFSPDGRYIACTLRNLDIANPPQGAWRSFCWRLTERRNRWLLRIPPGTFRSGGPPTDAWFSPATEEVPPSCERSGSSMGKRSVRRN